VKATGGAVVPSLAQKAFAAGKELTVISVGALLDHPEIVEESRSGLRDRWWGRSRSSGT
jgi:predicted dinucleotide-utilizing enzyme